MRYPSTNFNGSDYQPARDDVRLTKQFMRVFDFMKDGFPRTLASIARVTGDPEASISAQLRHMRKPRFGGHKVNKQYYKEGLYFYTLIVRKPGDIVVQPESKPHCKTCMCNPVRDAAVPAGQLGLLF